MMYDYDKDDRKEPLYREIGEAADVADELGLEGGVHPRKGPNDETMWAPGDSSRELDAVEKEGDLREEIEEAKAQTKEDIGTDDYMRI